MKTIFVRTIVLAALALTAMPALAERGDDANRKSKNGMTAGTVGGVEVEVAYGRPEARGREVWGNLVPYGKVWRTGADECSTITFADDAMVEGQAIAAGTYALFTIPGEDEWTVILNEDADQWGAFEYDESQDALRVPVTPTEDEAVEAMDIAIDGDTIVLRWAGVAVPIGITGAS